MDDVWELLTRAESAEREGQLTDAYELIQSATGKSSGGVRVETLLQGSRVLRRAARNDWNRCAVEYAEYARAEAGKYGGQFGHRAELEIAAAYANLHEVDAALTLVQPLLRNPPMGYEAGRAWFLLATIRDQQANYPAALASYQRAIAAYGTEPDVEREVAVSRGAVAGVLDRLGQSRIAGEMYAEAGAYWQGAGANDRRGYAIWLLNQAIVKRHLGNYVDSAEDSERAAKHFSRMQEMQHAQASALGNLAIARMALGRTPEAEHSAAIAVRLLVACGRPRRLADLRAILGNCHADQRKIDPANEQYRAAIATTEASELDRARYRILALLLRLQQSDIPSPEDLTEYADAIRKLEENPAGTQHDEALARANFGTLLERAGDLRRAERNYRVALERYAGLDGTQRSAARCRVDLAYVLAKQHRPHEALELAVAAAQFFDADRFTIKKHAQREDWLNKVVEPAMKLAMRLAAACGRDDVLSDLIILSRANGVRLSEEHYADEDWRVGDLPLGPLPTLLHPSDGRPMNDGGATTCFFV